MALNKLVLESNVKEWVSQYPCKLSWQEVCEKFGLDINDQRNKIFWNIINTHRVLVDENLLDYLGYQGKYFTKKANFKNLLKKNPHIEYKETIDEKDPRKRYYILNGIDFEQIMMQMRTAKIIELRELFSIIKMIRFKYCEYEKFYEKYQAQLLTSQNNLLLNSVKELKSLVVSVKTTAEEEMVRTEQELLKAEQKRQRAEEREKLAEQERQRAEEQSKMFTAQIRRNVEILNTSIAPRMTPTPISQNKIRMLGLYKTELDGEWYLMRRQQEGWRDAERKLFKRNMVLVDKWSDVAHAVDIGNIIKKHYRSFSWYARGNIIRAKDPSITGEHVRQMIYNIISKENDAHMLAHENENKL